MFRDEDLTLLARPLYAFLTVAPRGDRWPAPRPVWFEHSGDGTLQMFSDPGAPKLKQLREQPRASVVVSAPAGEPEHWVSVEGTVSLHDDGADLAARLADRYYDMADPAHQALVAEWRTTGMTRIVLHPAKVNRFAA
ncbi:pyridoxamine 5'-phosphate oxidase family protein [Paractinoplanes brasiliensis]|uniref:Pyridoxamine 5'-phosphate oxidase n=1 Tax=Paractinoplanes brasiliensis TaxID=52695 RepID=A0A4R6JBS4_9ACTN|nr:pyridoxamine 5'-phosphate oxidase family protein [Actinoplanes brasiliensis]TDO32737.1 pyridoxamine 5'-phosphate oxidase [Actinoplanes brasiliensis]GID31721.1 pyridoxamine 5'-phosphate oxidase [Actinoplanes brasiliensis]